MQSAHVNIVHLFKDTGDIRIEFDWLEMFEQHLRSQEILEKYLIG